MQVNLKIGHSAAFTVLCEKSISQLCQIKCKMINDSSSDFCELHSGMSILWVST